MIKKKYLVSVFIIESKGKVYEITLQVKKTTSCEVVRVQTRIYGPSFLKTDFLSNLHLLLKPNDNPHLLAG